MSCWLASQSGCSRGRRLPPGADQPGTSVTEERQRSCRRRDVALGPSTYTTGAASAMTTRRPSTQRSPAGTAHARRHGGQQRRLAQSTDRPRVSRRCARLGGISEPLSGGRTRLATARSKSARSRSPLALARSTWRSADPALTVRTSARDHARPTPARAWPAPPLACPCVVPNDTSFPPARAASSVTVVRCQLGDPEHAVTRHRQADPDRDLAAAVRPRCRSEFRDRRSGGDGAATRGADRRRGTTTNVVLAMAWQPGNVHP